MLRPTEEIDRSARALRVLPAICSELNFDQLSVAIFVTPHQIDSVLDPPHLVRIIHLYYGNEAKTLIRL